MLGVFILSYNRGEFLENCYKSVRRHIKDCIITVYDDNSDDLYTKKVLKNISSDGTRVIYSSFDKSYNESKVGGLNYNLNDILSNLAQNIYTLIIEDDIQILRNVQKIDLENIHFYFQHYPKSICLYVCFLKNNEGPIERYKIDNTYYFPVDNESNKQNFSYPGIWNVSLFRNSRIVLNNDMDVNRQNFKNQFEEMGKYLYPFMMYLPYPKSIKFGHRSLIRAIVEKLDNYGFYPYIETNLRGMDNFLNRNVDELPLMKNYISFKKKKKEVDLYFGDAMYRKPIIIWRIYRIELSIQKHFKYLKKVLRILKG